jgi:hypothetical protein
VIKYKYKKSTTFWFILYNRGYGKVSLLPDFLVEILAFHGTTESAAKKIVASKNFQIGTYRRDHWLGQGVYFFREDYRQALIWAYYKIKNAPELSDENAGVVYTKINVRLDEFLNLDTRGGLEYFRRYLTELKQFMERNGIKIKIDNPEKKKFILMCYYCDKLPKNIKVIQRTYKVTSSVFEQDENLSSVNMDLHGTQICVRDTSVFDYQNTGIYSIATNASNIQYIRRTKKSKRKISIEEE